MLKREVLPHLLQLANQYSAIAILGPRQAGKTTLAQQAFPQHAYISLEESLGAQEYAKTDPQGFLNSFGNPPGIIIDEFQHAPVLLSYIQLAIDAKKRPGYFILTGSQNFLVNEKISQTLAGRIALITLLPFSIRELRTAHLLPDLLEAATYTGFYPRIYDEKLDPTRWFSFYINTYIERDVRQIKNVTDLSRFQKFMQLCAGRIGQLLNIESLANDADLNVATVKAWLSVLEASYVVIRLQPYHKNFSKRIIKSPKLYFVDTGLACSLLGIESADQLFTHYLRGNLIENTIIADFYKQFYNQVRTPHLSFWRDQTGHEVDCIIERGQTLIPVEIKSNRTISLSFFEGLNYWKNLAKLNPASGFVVYSGVETQKWQTGTICSWQQIDQIIFP